jgi:hypothetical protein
MKATVIITQSWREVGRVLLSCDGQSSDLCVCVCVVLRYHQLGAGGSGLSS